MTEGRQRQRHGVSKNLVEGIGGLLVGAAAVLLLRAWLRPGTGAGAAPAAPALESTPEASPAPAQPKRRPRKKQSESNP